MTDIKSDSNPDKRGRDKPDNYLENWIERQSLVETMIPIIGKFHREKNVRILLYGTPLMTLSVIEIMQAHRKVREVEDNELSEYETSMVLASLEKLDVGPSQVDIGLLAAAFLFDDHGQNIDEFVSEQVKESLGKHDPVLTKPQDVVLFGFGRIGRLITRLILEDSGAGELLVTSMDRDGTQVGYDIELMSKISSKVNIPLIASGGVGNLDHLVEGIKSGKASAVLAASIFHYGKYSVKEAKQYLESKGIPVRT